MNGDLLRIIYSHNLSDSIMSVYGEDYYNSFSLSISKPLGFYDYDNLICELTFLDDEYNEYNDDVVYMLSSTLKDYGYNLILKDEPLGKLKSISLPFYNTLKKRFNNFTFFNNFKIILWIKQTEKQPEEEYQSDSNYIMSGEESVKEAISLLENYKPIQNGEGNGYMMYFKFTKEFINNKFFDLFGTDFNIINTQLKKLKVDKFYELRCYDTFEGFQEITQEEIIYHIKEYTSADGEYCFFTQYR